MLSPLVNRWRCLEAGCISGGEGTITEANKQAEAHTMKAPGHATLTWTEVPLPIDVPAPPAEGTKT